jgi:hypothetical protein
MIPYKKDCISVGLASTGLVRKIFRVLRSRKWVIKTEKLKEKIFVI